MKRTIQITLYWAVSLFLIAIIFAILREARLGAIEKSLVAALSFALAIWVHKRIFTSAILSEVAPTNASQTAMSGKAHGRPTHVPDNSHPSQPAEMPSKSGSAAMAEGGLAKQQAVSEDGMAQPTDKTSWSEEFNILYEYDPVVKECHDELENLEPELSTQFREEIVSDRKKASDVRDRLKAEHEKKINPYGSDELNEGLSEARLIGVKAEEEFIRVIDVMGEDVDVSNVLRRIGKKFGKMPVPEGEVAEMEYWGVTADGDKFILGSFEYGRREDAIAYAQKKLSDCLRKMMNYELKQILLDCDFTVQDKGGGEIRVTPTGGASTTMEAHKIGEYIRDNVSPMRIRKAYDFLK
jgi:hypothetical protein